MNYTHDPRLTLKAKGLMAHYLANGPGTHPSCPDGRMSIQSALRCLEKHGYVQREAVRSGGRIVRYELTLTNK